MKKKIMRNNLILEFSRCRENGKFEFYWRREKILIEKRYNTRTEGFSLEEREREIVCECACLPAGLPVTVG